MRNINKLISVFIISLLFAGCQVGLGEIVDMIPPTVTVNSPDRQGYILETVTIVGKATDNLAVSSLTLDLESIPDVNNPVAKLYKFRLENNQWEKFNDTTSTWEAYVNEYSKIVGTPKDFTWYLTYDLKDDATFYPETGSEFTVTTQVFDAYKNDGKNSKDERLVTLDKNEPNVTLIAPSVRKTYHNEEEANKNNYKLKDNSVLQNLLNGEFTISGSQKEDCQLDSMIIYLDEGTAPLPAADSTKPLSDEIKANVKYSSVISGSNLRNWNTQVDLSKIPGYEHDGKIVRLITESHDRAGNVETKVQGWFTYWNDADIPWINANFGREGDYTPNLEDNVSVYPSCALQGQAYDDDGLKEIVIKVYKENETTPCRDPEVINLESEDFPKYKAWSVNALGETCRFRVEIQCTDKNGKVSEKVTRYMKVTDANPPKINISTDTKESMLGDGNGNVNFSGSITDDGAIKSLKLIRVKTGIDPSLLIPLFNPKDSTWNKAIDAGQTFTVSKTENEVTTTIECGKIWNIPLGTETVTNNIRERTFSKDFNIFSDFGINGSTEKLSTQTFIIMATDVGGSSKIDTFTWAGDIKAPELSFEKVTVKKTGNKTEVIDFAEFNTEKKQKKLSPFEEGETIEISGKWKDNSTDKWTDKKKKGNLILKWNNESVSVKVKDDGTWTTGDVTPKNSTTAALYAELSDYAGNTTKINESFFVSSNNPQLIRITTKENDGYYKAGTQITILLEFNKAVGFYDGTGNPTLTLNVPSNGTYRTVECTSRYDKDAQGTPVVSLRTEHEFKYTIQTGDDIDKLNVTAINANGTVWKDADGLTVKNQGLPSTENRLNKTRSITIDTVAPKFTSLKAISPANSYNLGKEIFIQADFTEEVVISDTDIQNVKLLLNAKSGLTTTSALKTGPKTMLFTYTIGAGENTSSLNVEGIQFTSNSIKDTAGNSLTNTTVPAQTGINGIIIDTTAPTAPSVSGINNNAYYYDNRNISFTIGGATTDSKTIEYSLDGGVNWKTYSNTSVSISDDGEYKLTARQTDKAGNVSPNSTEIKFNIDNGNILTSVTAGIPTGTYTQGVDIPLYLNFRKKVVISEASLTLNLSNGQVANYEASGSTDTKAKFVYTVQDGDSSSGLNVESISGTFKDEHGNNIGTYVTTIPNGKNLADSKIIKIVTGVPALITNNSVVLSADGKTLTITFDRKISKGNGKSITIAQIENTYKAPAVLSVSEYNKLKGSISNLDTYYEKGYNGSDGNCVSDTTEKYILKYEYDTTNNTLLSLLKGANADKVIVPVNSTYVKVVDNNKLQISLDGSYKLPVKGSSYTVSIPASLVKDEKNHGNVENNTKTIAIGGFEKPVIRINKANEKITMKDNTVSEIEQPFQAAVKIDCQTPGVTCYYIVSSKENDTTFVGGVASNDPANNQKTPTLISCKQAKPSTISDNMIQGNSKIKYEDNPFKIGETESATTYYKGYIYLIGVKANKGTEWSETSYETAYRTAVRLKQQYSSVSYPNYWIRGGDNTYGGVTAEDFPFSWDSSEVDKIRAMTCYDTTNKIWYWITWKLNQTSYVGFVNGDYPADANLYGPKNWCWGDCGIVPYKSYYPLLPGSSLDFNTSVNWGTWVYMNQDKKKESRTYNNTTKKWEVSKAGN